MHVEFVQFLVLLNLLLHSNSASAISDSYGAVNYSTSWPSGVSHILAPPKSTILDCDKHVFTSSDWEDNAQKIVENVSLNMKPVGFRWLFYLNISEIAEGITNVFVRYRPLALKSDSVGPALSYDISPENMARHTQCQNVSLRSVGSPDTSILLPSPLIAASAGVRHSTISVPYRVDFTFTTPTSSYTGQFDFIIRETGLYGHLLAYNQSNHQSYPESPFYYLDTTRDNVVDVRIVPISESWNISSYQISLCRVESEEPVEEVLVSGNGKLQCIFTTFPDSGNYYVDVQVAGLGSHTPCIQPSRLFITVDESPRKLMRLIVSYVWLPFAIVIILCKARQIYNKRVSGKVNRNPKCLLVFAPTNNSHCEVMSSLKFYLKDCKITAALGHSDISNEQGVDGHIQRDQEIWLKKAFEDADTIIWATSPKFNPDQLPTPIYGNIHRYALGLIREYYASGTKQFWLLRFPYRQLDDIPPEVPQSTVFYMPKDLDKLVRKLHNLWFIKFPQASSDDLLNKIQKVRDNSSRISSQAVKVTQIDLSVDQKHDSVAVPLIDLNVFIPYEKRDESISRCSSNSQIDWTRQTIQSDESDEYEESDENENDRDDFHLPQNIPKYS